MLTTATIVVELSVTAAISGTAAKFYLRRSQKIRLSKRSSKPVNEQGILHFDRNTNLNPGVICDRCPQNTPLHPAEHPHANSAIPVGGGFR